MIQGHLVLEYGILHGDVAQPSEERMLGMRDAGISRRGLLFGAGAGAGISGVAPTRARAPQSKSVGPCYHRFMVGGHGRFGWTHLWGDPKRTFTGASPGDIALDAVRQHGTSQLRQINSCNGCPIDFRPPHTSAGQARGKRPLSHAWFQPSMSEPEYKDIGRQPEMYGCPAGPSTWP